MQVSIQFYDIYKRNFRAAFMHFWLGFIFYMAYQNTLCTRDMNLGIEKLLIILVFVFCQIVFLKLSNKIKRVRITDIKPEKEYQDNKLEEYWDRNIGNESLNSYVKMNIKQKNGKLITLRENIKKFSLSRGTKLKLKNGKTVSITGFEYSKDQNGKSREISYTQSNDNFEYSDVTLNLDKSIDLNQPFIYVKMSESEGNTFEKNSEINGKIGNKLDGIKERKGEIRKNIKLLKDQIKEESKKYQKSIKDQGNRVREQLEKQYKRHMERLNHDIKKQTLLLNTILKENDTLLSMRERILNMRI